MQITDMTLCQLQTALQERQLSPRDVLTAYQNRITQVEQDVHAFITRCDPMTVDIRPDLPLSGIPVAVKDNLCTRGVRTTCASRMLENFTPTYNATAWQRLAQSGAILLGKTNLDEFAMGSDTTTGAFGPTYNPKDISRVPGGSSGGSAAAVAAGEVPLALGSDTGGSIRQPAAFCGVVGMKPTYGRVSRFGLIAFASSLDTVGPITRNVADNALALSILSGKDPQDSTTVEAPNLPERPLNDLRIGIPRQMMEGLAPDIRAAVMRAAHILECRGYTVEEVELPTLPAALSAYYVISSAEASSNLARFDGVRYGRRSEKADSLESLYALSRAEGFGDEVKRRILLGTYALSAGYWEEYYRKAQQVRTLVIRDFARSFASVDILLGPVAPTVAWKIGAKASPVERYQADLYCVPASLAGLPALSMPCGKADGLPVGIQLMAPAFHEGDIYRVAAAIEQEVD